jgi:hypothetical protein
MKRQNLLEIVAKEGKHHTRALTTFWNDLDSQEFRSL